MTRRLLFIFFFVFAVFISFPKNVFAAGSTTISCSTTTGDIGVNTALGCVPVELKQFVSWLLKYVFGIAGGIAFILMIIGFIQMTTSQGDPKAVQGAKETITSAIVGLLICIFAIFLLRLITINILQIPGIS